MTKTTIPPASASSSTSTTQLHADINWPVPTAGSDEATSSSPVFLSSSLSTSTGAPLAAPDAWVRPRRVRQSTLTTSTGRVSLLTPIELTRSTVQFAKMHAQFYQEEAYYAKCQVGEKILYPRQGEPATMLINPLISDELYFLSMLQTICTPPARGVYESRQSIPEVICRFKNIELTLREKDGSIEMYYRVRAESSYGVLSFDNKAPLYQALKAIISGDHIIDAGRAEKIMCAIVAFEKDVAQSEKTSSNLPLRQISAKDLLELCQYVQTAQGLTQLIALLASSPRIKTQLCSLKATLSYQHPTVARLLQRLIIQAVLSGNSPEKSQIIACLCQGLSEIARASTPLWRLNSSLLPSWSTAAKQLLGVDPRPMVKKTLGAKSLPSGLSIRTYEPLTRTTPFLDKFCDNLDAPPYWPDKASIDFFIDQGKLTEFIKIYFINNTDLFVNPYIKNDVLLELAQYAYDYDDNLIVTWIDMLNENGKIMKRCQQQLEEKLKSRQSAEASLASKLEKLMLYAILYRRTDKERSNAILVFVMGTLKQVRSAGKSINDCRVAQAWQRECDRLSYDPSSITLQLRNILLIEADTPEKITPIINQLMEVFPFVFAHQGTEQWIDMIRNIAQNLRSQEEGDILPKLKAIDEQLIKTINYPQYAVREDWGSITNTTQIMAATRLIGMRFFIYVLRDMLITEESSSSLSRFFSSAESQRQEKADRINAAIKVFIKLSQPDASYPRTPIRMEVFPEEAKVLAGLFASGELVDLFKPIIGVKLKEVPRPVNKATASDSGFSMSKLMSLFGSADTNQPSSSSYVTPSLTSTLQRDVTLDTDSDNDNNSDTDLKEHSTGL